MHSAEDLSFDAAIGSVAAADGTTFTTEVHALWTVGDKPNGGYLLALLARAAREVGNGDGTHAWEVLSTSITYLRPPELGPAEIRTTVLRQGRTAAHVRTVLVQGEHDLVDAVSVLGVLPPGATPRYDDIGPLVCATPDDCVRLPPTMPGGVRVGIMDVLDLRMDPSCIPFSGAPPAEGLPLGELRGWTRFADGREPDPLALLFFVDAIPPATLMLGSTGWVPTLQMSAYVRAQPSPGWLGIRLTANLVSGGMVDETCTVWDAQGVVVAQASQLARLRFPDETT